MSFKFVVCIGFASLFLKLTPDECADSTFVVDWQFCESQEYDAPELKSVSPVVIAS